MSYFINSNVLMKHVSSTHRICSYIQFLRGSKKVQFLRTKASGSTSAKAELSTLLSLLRGGGGSVAT